MENQYWRPDSNQPPPYYSGFPPPGAINRDLEHLRLLKIFHYVVAAWTGLSVSAVLIYVAIGAVILANPRELQVPNGERLPAFVGMFFILIGGAIVVVGWTVAGLTAYAGRCLARREKHTFCLVVAALNCLHPPIGAALGIFTLIVLLRDSVKPLFNSASNVHDNPR